MSKKKSNIPEAGDQGGQPTTTPASGPATAGSKKKQTSQVATAHGPTVAHPVAASAGQQHTPPSNLMEGKAKTDDTTSQKKSLSKDSEDTHTNPLGKTPKRASPREKTTPKIARDEEKATGNTRAVRSECPSSNSLTRTEPERAQAVNKPAKVAGIANSDLIGISTTPKPTPAVLPEKQKDPIGLDFDPDPGANIDWSAGKNKVDEKKVKKEVVIPLVKGDETGDGKKKGKPETKDASEKGSKNAAGTVVQEPVVAAKSTGPANRCAPTSKSAAVSSGIDNTDLIGISTTPKRTPAVLPEKQKDPIGLEFDQDPGANIDWSADKSKVDEKKVKKEVFIPLVKGDETVDGKKKGKPEAKDASEKGSTNAAGTVVQETVVAAKSTGPVNRCAPTSISAAVSSGIDNTHLIGISTAPKPTPAVLPEKQKDPIGLDFDKDPGANIDWSADKNKVDEKKVKKEVVIPLVKGDEAGDGKKKGKPEAKDASEKGSTNAAGTVVQETVVAAKSTGPANRCAPTSKSSAVSSGIDNTHLIGISTTPKRTPAVLPEKQKDPIGLDFDQDPGANIDWSADKNKVDEKKVKKEVFIPLVKGDETVDGKKKGKPEAKDASEKGSTNAAGTVVQETVVAAKSTGPANRCAPTSKSAAVSSGIDNTHLIGISTTPKPTPAVLPEKQKDPIGLDFDQDPGANIDWSADKNKVDEKKVKKEVVIPLVKGDETVDGKKKGKPETKDASEKGSTNAAGTVVQETVVAAKSTGPVNRCAPTSKSAAVSSGIDNTHLIGISTTPKPTPAVLPEKQKDPIGLEFDQDPGANIDWSADKNKVDEKKVKKEVVIPLVKGDEMVDGKNKGKPETKDASEKGSKNAAGTVVQETVVAAKSTGPVNRCAPTSKSAAVSSGIDNTHLIGISTTPKPTPAVLPEKQKDPIGLEFDQDPGANIDWSADKNKVDEKKVKKEVVIPLVKGDETVDGKNKGKPETKDASEKGSKNAAGTVVQETVVAAKSTGPVNRCAPTSKSAAVSSGIDNTDLIGISTTPKPTPAVLPEKQKDPIGLDFDQDPGANIDWSADKNKVDEKKVKKEVFIPLVKGDETGDGKKKGKPETKDASEKGSTNAAGTVVQETVVAAKSTGPVNRCAPTSISAAVSSGIDNTHLIGISTAPKPTPAVLPEKQKDPIGLDFDKDPGANIDWSADKNKVDEKKVKKEVVIPLVKGDETVDGKKKGKPETKDASEKGSTNAAGTVVQETVVAAKSSGPVNRCAPTSKSAAVSSGIDNTDLIGISTTPKPTPAVLLEKQKDPIGLEFDQDPGANIDWSAGKNKVGEKKVKKEVVIPLVKGDETVDGKKKGKPETKDASEKGSKNAAGTVVQETVVAAKSSGPVNRCAPTSKSSAVSSGINNTDLIGISTTPKPTPAVVPEKQKDPIGLDFDQDPGANIDWSAGKNKVGEKKVKKEVYTPLIKGDIDVSGEVKGTAASQKDMKGGAGSTVEEVLVAPKTASCVKVSAPCEKATSKETSISHRFSENLILSDEANVKGETTLFKKTTVVAEQLKTAAASGLQAAVACPGSKSSGILDTELMGVDMKAGKPTQAPASKENDETLDDIGLDFDDPNKNVPDWSEGRTLVNEKKIDKEVAFLLGKK